MVKVPVMLSGRRRLHGKMHGAALLASALSLWTSVGLAQSTSDDMARRHFDSGVAYLEESDYDNALKAFQKAYDLSKRPEILLNIATVQERQSDLRGAVASLQAYLTAAPDGEHAETVKLRIQNLEKRLKEQESAQQPAPVPPPPVKSAASPAPVPTPAPAPAKDAAKPEPNRLPAFISIGVGGVMAGGALVTGLVASSKYQDAKDSCGHRCSDSQLSGSRAFAITSTVLTGAAVLGVGLGIGLLFATDNEGDSLAHNAKPRIDVALGPKLAAANAAWSF